MGFCLMLKICPKILVKIVGGKYSQKHFGHAKQSATDPLGATSKRVI